jgi:hypothetical protein
VGLILSFRAKAWGLSREGRLEPVPDVAPPHRAAIGTRASFHGGGAGATVRAVFRNLLVLPDGEINDPAVFTTPVPNYDVGEVFMLGDGEQLRIVHLDLELDEAAVEHLFQQGINGIWIVEPVE